MSKLSKILQEVVNKLAVT